MDVAVTGFRQMAFKGNAITEQAADEKGFSDQCIKRWTECSLLSSKMTETYTPPFRLKAKKSDR